MDEVSFQYLMGALPRLLLTRLKILHYLHLTEEGRYLCLDLNLSSDSEEALTEMVKEWIQTHEPHDLLPAAPEADWRKLAEVTDSRNKHDSHAIFTSHKAAFKVGTAIYKLVMEKWPN